MYKTAKAIEIRLSLPIANVAKAVVMINPNKRVVKHAKTIFRDPNPINNIIATRIIDNNIAFIFASETLFSSS